MGGRRGAGGLGERDRQFGPMVRLAGNSFSESQKGFSFRFWCESWTVLMRDCLRQECFGGVGVGDTQGQCLGGMNAPGTQPRSVNTCCIEEDTQAK